MDTIALYLSKLSVIETNTILKCAIYYQNLDIFISLIPYIENFDIRIDNDIFLYVAVHSNNIESVTYFMDRGLDITAVNNYIIKHMELSNEILELLVSYGIDINIDNGALLINAVNNGSIKCIELLINHGADYSLQNYEAVKLSLLREKEFILFFINLGFDININMINC